MFADIIDHVACEDIAEERVVFEAKMAVSLSARALQVPVLYINYLALYPSGPDSPQHRTVARRTGWMRPISHP